MKTIPIFRARIVESSVRVYTSSRLLLPPKKISIALDGRTCVQHIVCHLYEVHYRNYFKKDAFVYVDNTSYRRDAKYGRTSVFYGHAMTELGMEYDQPIGDISHPTFSLDYLEREFEKMHLVQARRINERSFEFGIPTSRGIICDSEENTTLAILAQ